MTQFNVGDRVKLDDRRLGAVLCVGVEQLFVKEDGRVSEACWHRSRCTLVPRTVTVTIPADLGEWAVESRDQVGYKDRYTELADAVADSLRQQEKGPTP